MRSARVTTLRTFARRTKAGGFSMRADVVYTRIRTRDPVELAQYTTQSPAFVAGHTVERLAWKGSEGKVSATNHGTTLSTNLPPATRVGFAM
jgi:hypothetical protein